MLRLVIVIVFYALVVFTLPGWEPYANLADQLSRLPARLALIVNLVSLLASVVCLYALLRQPAGLIYRKPSDLLLILRTGLIGVVFSTLFDLAEGLSGYAMTVNNLLILPIAFMIGEAAYVLVCRLFPQFTSQSGAQNATNQNQGIADDSQSPSGIPRLLVTVPVYVFILVFLPRHQDFQSLTRGFDNIPPLHGLGVTVSALIIAAILFLWTDFTFNRSNERDKDFKLPDARAADIRKSKLNIYATFSLSLGIAAVINLVGFFIGYAPSMTLLIIMTLGFTIAEAVYALVNIRVKHGPMGM